jgi:predicted transcriptional regulator
MRALSVSRPGGNNQELTRALQGVGFLRTEAVLLTCLSSVSRASCREIESATGMKTPDFRTALKKLEDNRLIDVTVAESSRTGRPSKLYRLNLSLYGIASRLEEVQRQEISRLSESLHRLKELRSTNGINASEE